MDSNEEKLTQADSIEVKSIFADLPNNQIPFVSSALPISTIADRINKWNQKANSCNDINAFLYYANKYLSKLPMPFSGYTIPVSEHSRILAAVACCFKGQDYDPNKKSLLLYSIDISGIQSFIYAVGSGGALKGLKTRSFYLNIIMQHTTDQLLAECGLTRINVIYCGGGKAYMLLPNTKQILEITQKLLAEANEFLQNHFGTKLYLASGYAQASLLDLVSGDGSTAAFGDLFRTASSMISQKKTRRYSAEQLIAFNSTEENHERECVICGSGAHLLKRREDWLCEDCLRFENFSQVINTPAFRLTVTKEAVQPCLSLPFNAYLCLAENTTSADRCYAINKEPQQGDIPLTTGNYQNKDNNTFELLAGASKGIKRIGIFRMDVDNLGSLFCNGFADQKLAKPWKKMSLVRYGLLSAAMTTFFQDTVNEIVKSGMVTASVSDPTDKRNVSIVYSGGDDVFLAGAWNDVADAGTAIYEAFREYTHGNITISGGLGIFGDKYPVRQMAAKCAILQDAAKDVPGKASVALFDSTSAYSWKDYQQHILQEMLPAINTIAGAEASSGNSFLYHIMQLLRSINDGSKIEIARLAYLLARHCPKGNALQYNHVSQKLYQWALEQDNNKRLQTAIQLYVYLHRKGNEE